MNEELNLQSIADLPVVDGIADGDYIVTVSGGKGKRLPADKFSGGGSVTIFNSVVADTSSDGQLMLIVVDESGNPYPDATVFREALLAGTVRVKTTIEGIDVYIEPDAVADAGPAMMGSSAGVYFLMNLIVVFFVGDTASLDSVEALSL